MKVYYKYVYAKEICNIWNISHQLLITENMQITTLLTVSLVDLLSPSIGTRWKEYATQTYKASEHTEHTDIQTHRRQIKMVH